MKTFSCLLSFLFVAVIAGKSAAEYVPTEENLAARAAFEDRQFGIFIHWGLYAAHGQGEWYFNQSGLYRTEDGRAQYASVTNDFNPVKFDAAAWARAFKDSGARYVTITSRHHDGFSMFDTDETDYDIVDATPYGKDPLADLAKACADEGLAFGFYYSLLDWWREDYPRSVSDDYQSYFDFMCGQVRELLTNYGPVHCIWLDGQWDHAPGTGFDWRLDEFYALIHSLQPSCLVGNNSHYDLGDGEDFQIWEINYPGEHTGHMNDTQTIATNVPLECCWSTTDQAWGYNPNDPLLTMTAKEIVRRLVRTRSKGANLLLNVGPAPDGTIPDTITNRLATVGDWIDEYGYTVLGTGPAQYAVMSTVSTRSKDGRKVYLHCMPNAANASYGMWMTAYDKVLAVTDLMTGQKLSFTQKDNSGVSKLSIPAFAIDEDCFDYIIQLDVEPFDAPDDPPDPLGPPVIGTPVVESITTNSSTISVSLVALGDGNPSVTLSVSASPAVPAPDPQVISAAGDVSFALSGLAPATLYTAEVVAVGAVQGAVTSTVSFTTLALPKPPKPAGEWFTVDLEGDDYAAWPDVSAAEGTWLGVGGSTLSDGFVKMNGTVRYLPESASVAKSNVVVSGSLVVSPVTELPTPVADALGGVCFLCVDAPEPYVYAGEWVRASGPDPVAASDEVEWSMIFDFASNTVTYVLDGVTNSPTILPPETADRVTEVSYVGVGSFGSFRGRYCEVVAVVEFPTNVLFKTDGSGIVLDSANRTISLSIANPVPGVKYAVFASATLDGTYVAVTTSQIPIATDVLDFANLSAEADTQFFKVVATRSDVKIGDTLPDID